MIVSYCGGPGCGAYKRGADAAAKLGYKNIKHLSAGISGWKKAGADIAKSKYFHGKGGIVYKYPLFYFWLKTFKILSRSSSSKCEPKKDNSVFFEKLFSLVKS